MDYAGRICRRNYGSERDYRNYQGYPGNQADSNAADELCAVVYRADLRNVFLGLASRAQELAEKPEFYNTLTQNCTTTLLKPMRPALGALHKDIRLIANGLIDHMAYELGYLDTEGYQIETAKNRYRIPSGIPGDGAEYSRLLRKVMYQEKEQNP